MANERPPKEPYVIRPAPLLPRWMARFGIEAGGGKPPSPDAVLRELRTLAGDINDSVDDINKLALRAAGEGNALLMTSTLEVSESVENARRQVDNIVRRITGGRL